MRIFEGGKKNMLNNQVVLDSMDMLFWKLSHLKMEGMNLLMILKVELFLENILLL